MISKAPIVSSRFHPTAPKDERLSKASRTVSGAAGDVRPRRPCAPAARGAMSTVALSYGVVSGVHTTGTSPELSHSRRLS